MLFTAPTAYRAMLAARGGADLSQPAPMRLGRRDAALADLRGLEGRDRHYLMDGIGATEMLHIFIGSPPEEIRPGATGHAGARAIEAKIVDDGGTRGAARHARRSRRARADRLPLSRRRRGRRATCATAGT